MAKAFGYIGQEVGWGGEREATDAWRGGRSHWIYLLQWPRVRMKNIRRRLVPDR